MGLSGKPHCSLDCVCSVPGHLVNK